MSEFIRGRWHPNLHPILRVNRPGPRCRSLGPAETDEDGQEWCVECIRTAGHTGRHLAYEWDFTPPNSTQKPLVWTDKQATTRLDADETLS